jgi:hypothetical protein
MSGRLSLRWPRRPAVSKYTTKCRSKLVPSPHVITWEGFIVTSKTNNKNTTGPEALSIPGLIFRRFRGDSDYPQIAEVFTRSWEADGKDAAHFPP